MFTTLPEALPAELSYSVNSSCEDLSLSTRSCRTGEPKLATPKAPEGASEEVKKAFASNTATLNEVLDLRNISIGSSHMADADVDPEYVCPICLVSLPERCIGLDAP